jgi:hypothetical protein
MFICVYVDTYICIDMFILNACAVLAQFDRHQSALGKGILFID